MNVATLLTRKLGIYLFAVLVAYGLAVVTASQHVVSSLASMGVEVGLADRLAMTLADLAGMAGMFVALVDDFQNNRRQGVGQFGTNGGFD